MKSFNTFSPQHENLLLVFGGWSATPEMFSHLILPSDTDLSICYDYRDLDFDIDLSAYRSINVVAWSLGVWVANQIMSTREGNYSRRIAVNGSLNPISDTDGIPEDIFTATLQNVNPEGLRRFNRRVCGSKQLLEKYLSFGSRPAEELREELESLYASIKTLPIDTNIRWNTAIIGEDDRIFPSSNLENFWLNRAQIKKIKEPHYPFSLWKHWNEITE